MIPYYIWTLRVWCFDINWKRSGLWRLNVEYLSRRSYVGKYQFRFFKHK